MAHDPSKTDYSSDEWANGYADGLLGRSFDDEYEGDDSYTEGYIMGDAEAGSPNQPAPRGDCIDSTGKSWQWAVGPTGQVVLAEVDGSARLHLPNEAVAQAASRLPGGRTPQQ